MTREEELKHCPFCGCKSTVVKHKRKIKDYEERGVCTGEHVPETIAMEASRKIKELGNMCEEMAECLEYFSRLESYSDVGGIFQIKTDNIMYAKNILTKWNAMKGE